MIAFDVTVVLPVRYKQKGMSVRGFKSVTVPIEVQEIDAAPVAFRYPQDEFVEEVRSHAGTLWIPFRFRNAVMTPDQFAGNSGYFWYNEAHLVGLPKIAAMNIMQAEHLKDKPVDSPAFLDDLQATIRETSVQVSGNMLLIDGVMHRRCGVPRLVLSVETGSYLKTTIGFAADMPDGPLTATFGIGRQAELFAFRDGLGKARNVGIPDYEVLMPDSCVGPETELVARGIRHWLLRDLPRDAFGNLPVPAIEVIRDLRREDITPEEILEQVRYLCLVMGVEGEGQLPAQRLFDDLGVRVEPPAEKFKRMLLLLARRLLLVVD